MAAAADGRVVLWHLDPAQAVRRFRANLAGAALPADWRTRGVDPGRAPCR